MKVLLSAYACLPGTGSEPGSGWNWAVHLAERGMDVHVLTVAEERERLNLYMAAHPNPRIKFSFVSASKRFKHCGGMHYALWQWAAVKVAREAMKTERFDIVHHVSYGSVHVPSQLWRLGLPVVFGPVGGGQTTPVSMLSEFGTSQRKERMRSLLTRVLPYSPFHRAWLGRMRVVLATNRDTLNLIRAMGRQDVEMQSDPALPESFLAVKPRDFRNEQSTDAHAAGRPLRLLWVGRMLPRKALPMTLDVMAKLSCDARLTIVGEGIEATALRQMIEERGLTGRVDWAGHRLPLSEVRTAYLEHDAMLFLSLRDSCAGQLLESMALGLPVITLDLHGAMDMVPDDAGYKVAVTTPVGVVRDVAAAVDRYAALAAEEWTTMSLAGWNRARQMLWTQRAEVAEQMYRNIIETDRVLPGAASSPMPSRRLALGARRAT